jgi:hypothetical protein
MLDFNIKNGERLGVRHTSLASLLKNGGGVTTSGSVVSKSNNEQAQSAAEKVASVRPTTTASQSNFVMELEV